MRVIAGTARSLQLKTLPGNDTRPTTDRIKETLFNMIGPEVCGARFLDLYSGSGAIGIEALSRGACEAVFMEKNRRACDVIRQNLAFTKLSDAGRIMQTDVLSGLSRLSGCFDLIFMDPPYRMDLERRTLEILADSELIHSETMIIAEAAIETDFSYTEQLGFQVIRQKVYKTNQHLFLRRV